MDKKMKKKKKWSDKQDFYISVDMFKVDIVFICNCNEKEVKERFKKASGDNFKHFKKGMTEGWDNIYNTGRMFSFRGGFVVLLKNEGNFRRFVANLVHEVTHVTHYLLRDRRIPLNDDTEEIYTYLVEYITEQALIKLYD